MNAVIENRITTAKPTELEGLASIKAAESSLHADEASVLAAVVELLTQLDEIDDFPTAVHHAAVALCKCCDAKRVVFGWRFHHASGNVAIADSHRIFDPHDRNDQAMRKLSFALDELSLIQQVISVDLHQQSSSQPGRLALRAFAGQEQATRIVGAAMLDAKGMNHGAWLLVDPAETIQGLRIENVVAAMTNPLAGRLASIRRRQPRRWQRSLQSMHAFVSGQRRWTLSAGMLMLLLLLMYPTRYTVRCDCVLQPVARRVVAAPFDGSLEEAFVQPGDSVRQGQRLARISARELDWELAGLKADLSRSIKERKVSLAKQDYAASQIAQLESQRLSSRVELIENRIEHLDIRSPIDGVVVSGDLHEVKGAPLETGESLFQIAPLGAMDVELMIPEDDFMYVKPGMSVRLRLDAFADEQVTGRVQRISPQAEVLENRNVFVAELRLNDPHGLYRPGMRGDAVVQSIRRPFFWVWFHKPWSMLRNRCFDLIGICAVRGPK
ncbi:MAG: HlyD family efflux transporter periplasmic adaptor subunit [Pirellulaceae bacterium]